MASKSQVKPSKMAPKNDVKPYKMASKTNFFIEDPEYRMIWRDAVLYFCLSPILHVLYHLLYIECV